MGVELRIWCKETKFPAAGMSWAEHAAFSEWLTARYPVPIAKPAREERPIM
jgi:hypothetical protein